MTRGSESPIRGVGTAIVDIVANSTYENFLPALNVTWSAMDNLKLRFSAEDQRAIGTPFVG